MLCVQRMRSQDERTIFVFHFQNHVIRREPIHLSLPVENEARKAGNQAVGRNGYPVSDSVATISPGKNELDIQRHPITCIVAFRADTLTNEGGSITACRPIAYIQLLVEANAKRMIPHVSV